MRTKAIWICLFMGTALLRAGSFTDFDTIDDLYKKGELEETLQLSTRNIQYAHTDLEKLQSLWRSSRASLYRGDELKEEGYSNRDLRVFYENGIHYAEEAIMLNPGLAEAYYFKGLNTGRLGEMRPLGDGLQKVEDMRDYLIQAINCKENFSPAWHVLGILYERVPAIISFGNKRAAVSLGRKSIAVMQSEVDKGELDALQYDYYLELASHLYERNWSVRKREREISRMRDKYLAASSVFEKGLYYEGSHPRPACSDREEARQLIDRVLSEISSLTDLSLRDKADLKKALEMKRVLFG